jgi:hypothetical protein
MKRHSSKNGFPFSLALSSAFLLFCIGYLAITDISLQKRKNALDYQFKEISSKKQVAQIKNDSLKAEVGEIGNKDYQEKILREKGMYKKTGEGIISVKDLDLNATTTKNNNENNLPFWQMLINKIKDLVK